MFSGVKGGVGKPQLSNMFHIFIFLLFLVFYHVLVLLLITILSLITMLMLISTFTLKGGWGLEWYQMVGHSIGHRPPGLD